METIISRAEAKAQGLKQYFSGIPCKHGHLSNKFVSNRACVSCAKVSQKDRDSSARCKLWRAANLERERERERTNKKLDLAGGKYRTAKRRAAKLQATPLWADLDAIQFIYDHCPTGHEVDHIVPLISDKVCGLHIAVNLTYLTEFENRSKGNRFWPDQF